MPKVRINVTAGGSNSLNANIPAGTTPTVEFFTTDNSKVTVEFSGTPPFTDTTNPFSVQGDPGVDRTVSTGASTGGHDFTAGTRTGDIDITVSR